MKRLFALFAATAAACLGGAAMAQSDIESAVEAAIACRSIASDGERLACLDAAAGGLEAARNALTARNAEEKRGVLARFGLSGGDDDEDAPRKKAETVEDFGAEGILAERQARMEEKLGSITATTTKIAINSRREATLYLDNGQVWRQLSADNKKLGYSDKDDPYPVEIKRSAFGNYMATIEGLDRTIRVRRIK